MTILSRVSPLLYGSALAAASTVMLPRMLYQMVKHGKYRDSFPKRWGWSCPYLPSHGKQTIWIHAVSVGETRAVATLAKRLKAEHPGARLVISSITETGHVEAKRSLSEADLHLYLPIDYAWNVRLMLRRIQPDWVIVCETDCWYNFLRLAKKQGAKLALVNGKVSEKSLEKYRKFPWVPKALFGMFDVLAVQSEEYRARFAQMGVASQKIAVTGNLKFDGIYPKMDVKTRKRMLRRLRIQAGDPVVIAGSTHDPEEHQILQQMRVVWDWNPHARLILVPRHPERFDQVEQLLRDKGVTYTRYSQNDLTEEAPQVILIDAMGMLRDLYQLADVAIVAGSFTKKVGGHNIMEPLWYGTPTLFGPHMFMQPELLRLMKQYNAGVQLEIDALGDTLQQLLEHEPIRQQLALAGKRLLQDVRGATDRTCQLLDK